MNIRTDQQELLRFGAFDLDLANGELRKNGRRVALQPQPFKVLAILASQSGTLVTREELRHQLWNGSVFVDFEDGMNFCIRRIRIALDDNADHPRYVQTVRGRGYRFLAPVTPFPNPARNTAAFGLGTALSPAPAEPPTATSVNEPSAVRVRASLRYLVVACILTVLLGSLLFARFGFRTTRPVLAEQRITANSPEAPITAAVISADGKYVAYADTTGIYIRHLDSGETHPLPFSEELKAVPTSWFRDGSHILLSPDKIQSGNTDLWKVSILGGAPQKLIENGIGGVVSPDGSEIAFLRSYAPAKWEIWLVGADGGNPSRLADISGLGESGDANGILEKSKYSDTTIPRLAWSPDGRRVAYILGFWRTAPSPLQNVDYVLETVDIGGGPPKLLKKSSQLLPALCWTPDGRLLYGLRNDPASELDNSGVWSLRVNQKSGTMEGAAWQLTTGVGRIGGMSVTADGKRLIVWRVNTQPEIFLSEIDSGTGRFKAPRRLTLDENGNVATAWAPDSSALFFYSNRSGTWKVFRQRINLVTPEIIVEGHGIALPRLDPDGTHILYLSGYNSENPTQPISVMKVSLPEGSPQVVLRKPSIFNMQCARRPSRLCLLSTREASKQELFSFDPEDGRMEKFATFQTMRDLNWSLSPDGSQLALIEGPGSKVTFMAVNSKKTHDVVLPDWAALQAIDWAADGRSVWMATRKSNGLPVILSLEPGGSHRLLFEGVVPARFWWAIPSPDGRNAALVEDSGENNVWMVENF